MNISKFTQNSIQAVERCEKLAYEYGNQEIEQEHLLYSLLTIEDSLILKLIEKMEIQKEYFVNRVKQALEKRVKVQGGQVYIGQYLNKVLISAEDEAKQMGDEYVSVVPVDDQRTKQGDQGDLPGVRHHKGAFFAGIVHDPGQSAGDER